VKKTEMLFLFCDFYNKIFFIFVILQIQTTSMYFLYNEKERKK